MNDLYLTRRIFTPNSTVGKLIMAPLELWTLEDSARNIKVAGVTCIPSGTYTIQIRPSERYQKPMPYLLNVPFFEGIMIHPGNTDADTKGCILVGMNHPAENTIGGSKEAFNLLFPRIEQEIARGVLKIHIAGGYSKQEFEEARKKPVRYA